MTSSAIAEDNPEVVEARARRIPVIPRAEMLAELMRLRYGIAIAGAHGKTTTTSMIALVLDRAGLDPTAVIGGRLSAFGSNARLGKRRLHGGGGRRERPVVSEAVAVDCRHHEHRSRAHGKLTAPGTTCSRRSRTSRTRCRSMARWWRARDDRAGPRADAAPDATGHYLRAGRAERSSASDMRAAGVRSRLHRDSGAAGRAPRGARSAAARRSPAATTS